MFDKFSIIGIMSCLFALAILIQNIRVPLKESGRFTFLQAILQIFSILLWFLSFPVTIIAFLLWIPINDRIERVHKSELAKNSLESYEAMDRKVAPLEKELQEYRESAAFERSIGRRDGYDSGYKIGFLNGHQSGAEFVMSSLLIPEEERHSLRISALKAARNHADRLNSDLE